MSGAERQGRAWRGALALAAVLAAGGALSSLALKDTARSPRVDLGVTVGGDPDSRLLDAYSRLASRPPRIVMWFQSWSEPLFYPGQMAAATRTGATPMVTWDPAFAGASGPRLDAITAGSYDSYLLQSAALARRWHKPLYVRFAHEMNLDTQPWGAGRPGNGAAEFIGAWRHVVALFRRAGATNVRWVWSPNVDCQGRCPFTGLYPGDRYVDAAALDGYNYAAVRGLPWMSFAQVFARSYAELTRLTPKPVMIAETASVEQGGDKAAWIRSALEREVPARFPRVRALIWWDRISDGGDFRVQSSPAALRAWRAAVASAPYVPSAGLSAWLALLPATAALALAGMLLVTARRAGSAPLRGTR